jgi:hypothetical protein
VVNLLRCAGCLFVTGDATPSRHDGQPRCGPCERHADHDRRLARGDQEADGLVSKHAGLAERYFASRELGAQGT